MARKLISVTNNTGSDAFLTSTVSNDDDCAIPNQQTTHTGGSDGDFIYLPDCSDSGYWPDYHITIKANDQAWAVSFWSDDQDNRMFQWSQCDGYGVPTFAPGSDESDDCTIQITLDDAGLPLISWSPWESEKNKQRA